MNSPDCGQEPRGVVAGRRRWFLRLGLGSLAVFAHLWGIVLPAVSPIYPEFHREFFAIARWLRETDSDPVRGRTCARFYEAVGVWLGSMMVGGTMILVVLLEEAVASRVRQAPGAASIRQAWTFGVAFTLAGAAGFASAAKALTAVRSARQLRLKVWIGPEVRRAWQRDAWPPSLAWEDVSGPNEIRDFVAPVVGLGLFMGSSFVMLSVTLLPSLVLGLDLPAWLVIGMSLAAFGVPFLVATWVRHRSLPRIAAASPRECWPPPGGWT